METNNKDIQYERAKKRVKEIKGFYIHALVFALVNLFLIGVKFAKYESFEEFFQHNQFWGIGLWGIGLFAHGLSVFLPNFILGNNWEEKKIRELMDKDKM